MSTKFSRDLDIYTHFLKHFSAYEFENNAYEPFQYQDMENENLQRIREYFYLGKVVDGKSEIDTIILLMQWVNQIFKWDGGVKYVGLKNIFDIHNFCQKENSGVNCRMLATVLNEVYLSFGFKTKFVTCMPMGMDFSDCHVVNLVFSKTENRWIFMDPSFGVYIKDSDGTLLGLKELREGLSQNQDLIVNTDAQYPGDIKEYLAYMTKNLFWFTINRVSEYNHESHEGNKTTYTLSPKDYFQQPRLNIIKKGEYKTYNFRISNPEFFWN